MRFFTFIFIVLLCYVVSALLFWGFSLHRQAEVIYQQECQLLSYSIDSNVQNERYHVELSNLERKRTARTKQYLGEGGTFLALILAGAGVVFTSFRRRLNLSRQQNNFMLSVTHELKSPVAAMRLNLQTLQRTGLTEEQRERLISRSIIEADRLNELCNNMLVASQMEGGQYKVSREELDFSDLISKRVTDYAQRYPERIRQNVQEQIFISGDEWLLSMAVNNLLENAIKYTPSDLPVSVALHSVKGKAILSVADEGKGIPDSEKKRVFTKFYRIGDENTRSTKGTGLGLYLVDKIVRQHRGKVCVRNNKPRGAVFEMTIPVIAG